MQTPEKPTFLQTFKVMWPSVLLAVLSLLVTEAGRDLVFPNGRQAPLLSMVYGKEAAPWYVAFYFEHILIWILISCTAFGVSIGQIARRQPIPVLATIPAVPLVLGVLAQYAVIGKLTALVSKMAG